ncbi:MAG: alpha/beta fold hydrolase [Actinomycetota bacterium]|jgi:3-oxoadipate enol-lactonase
MATTTLYDRELHYRDEGSGDDPVVLIHALPLDGSMWEPQLEAFRTRCRLIAPDLAGFGGSQPLPEAEGNLIDRWADDVIGLLGALGIDHATVVGASLGADVALAMTRRARDAVGGLGLAGLRGDIGPEEAGQRLEQAEWVANGGDRQSILERLVDDFAGPKSPHRSEVAQRIHFVATATSTVGWVAALRAMTERPETAADLAKVDVPTIFLVGEDDRLAPPDDVRALAARAPEAGVIEIPRAGHLANLDNPAAFNRALEDLLAGREARRSPGKHSWPATPAVH